MESLKCTFMQVFRVQSAGSAGIIKRIPGVEQLWCLLHHLWMTETLELMAQLLINLHLSSHPGCGGNSWYWGCSSTNLSFAKILSTLSKVAYRKTLHFGSNHILQILTICSRMMSKSLTKCWKVKNSDFKILIFLSKKLYTQLWVYNFQSYIPNSGYITFRSYIPWVYKSYTRFGQFGKVWSPDQRKSLPF